MKILITENKRKQLAYHMLDEVLNNLTRKHINLNKDSILSNWQVLFIDKNGEIVIRWSEGRDFLYVSEDLLVPLKSLSFDEIESTNLIYDWFTNKANLYVTEMEFVPPGSLNWEDMGLDGLMGAF
jgi:hypothetical protein